MPEILANPTSKQPTREALHKLSHEKVKLWTSQDLNKPSHEQAKNKPSHDQDTAIVKTRSSSRHAITHKIHLRIVSIAQYRDSDGTVSNLLHALLMHFEVNFEVPLSSLHVNKQCEQILNPFLSRMASRATLSRAPLLSGMTHVVVYLLPNFYR